MDLSRYADEDFCDKFWKLLDNVDFRTSADRAAQMDQYASNFNRTYEGLLAQSADSRGRP